MKQNLAFFAFTNINCGFNRLPRVCSKKLNVYNNSETNVQLGMDSFVNNINKIFFQTHQCSIFFLSGSGFGQFYSKYLVY